MPYLTAISSLFYIAPFIFGIRSFWMHPVIATPWRGDTRLALRCTSGRFDAKGSLDCGKVLQALPERRSISSVVGDYRSVITPWHSSLFGTLRPCQIRRDGSKCKILFVVYKECLFHFEVSTLLLLNIDSWVSWSVLQQVPTGM